MIRIEIYKITLGQIMTIAISSGVILIAVFVFLAQLRFEYWQVSYIAIGISLLCILGVCTKVLFTQRSSVIGIYDTPPDNNKPTTGQ